MKKFINFINLLILLHEFCLTSSLNADDDSSCYSPWRIVGDDICLLIKSDIQNWEHSRMICAFENKKSSLLYIDNSVEQNQIKDFISSIKKYRYSSRPHIWLDLTNQFSSDKSWKWSRNNQNLNYTNWEEKRLGNKEDEHRIREFRSNFLNCACFSLSDSNLGSWSECDCSTKQHLICRKPMAKDGKNFDKKDTSAQVSKANPKEKEKNSNESNKNQTNAALTNEENAVIVISQDEEAVKSGPNVISTDELIDKYGLKSLSKEMNSFMERTGKGDTAGFSFIEVLRKKIAKNSFVFKYLECPYGFGYYSINKNDCATYKLCDSWDKSFAIVTLNRCGDGMIFSFVLFRCIPNDAFGSHYCLSAPRFVPL